MRFRIKMADRGEAMIPVAEYAAWMGVSSKTVHGWCAEGRLKFRMSGNYNREDRYGMLVEKVAIPARQVMGGDTDARGHKRCTGCRDYLPPTEFMPSALVKIGQRCRLCVRHATLLREGRLHPIEQTITAQNVEAVFNREKLTPQGRAEREVCIDSHIDRIASEGQAGDGREWHEES